MVVCAIAETPYAFEVTSLSANRRISQVERTASSIESITPYCHILQKIIMMVNGKDIRGQLFTRKFEFVYGQIRYTASLLIYILSKPNMPALHITPIVQKSKRFLFSISKYGKLIQFINLRFCTDTRTYNPP